MPIDDLDFVPSRYREGFDNGYKRARHEAADEIERLRRGAQEVKAFLEEKPPRIGDATFALEAILTN